MNIFKQEFLGPSNFPLVNMQHSDSGHIGTISEQLTMEPFTSRPLDFSKSLKDQRPVLKKSRLRRSFEPHRDRIDFSHVQCAKERRRLRSQDNARLYRDREKQRIIDLENSIEQLREEQSRLTIKNTTLDYKYNSLLKYVNQSTPDLNGTQCVNQVLEETTQIRSDLTAASEHSQEISLEHLEYTGTIGANNQLFSERNVKGLQLDLSKTSTITEKVINVTSESGLETPLSCYGSAEPSPAELLGKQPVMTIGKPSQFVFPPLV